MIPTENMQTSYTVMCHGPFPFRMQKPLARYCTVCEVMMRAHVKEMGEESSIITGRDPLIHQFLSLLLSLFYNMLLT